MNIILMKGDHYVINCEEYENYKETQTLYTDWNERYNCSKMIKEGDKSLNFDINSLTDQMKRAAPSKTVNIKYLSYH